MFFFSSENLSVQYKCSGEGSGLSKLYVTNVIQSYLILRVLLYETKKLNEIKAFNHLYPGWFYKIVVQIFNLILN